MKYLKFPFQSSHLIKGKPFKVYCSNAAEQALQVRSRALIVEMELKFACMVRMLVHFHDQVDGVDSIEISDKLSVFYRPMMGQCDSNGALKDEQGAVIMGELTSGPMAKRFPKQLGIDFVRGEWRGEFS